MKFCSTLVVSLFILVSIGCGDAKKSDVQGKPPLDPGSVKQPVKSFSSGMTMHPVDMLFGRRDKNGDGLISNDEFPDGGLVEFDTNKDGQVTLEEAYALYPRKKEKGKKESGKKDESPKPDAKKTETNKEDLKTKPIEKESEKSKKNESDQPGEKKKPKLIRRIDLSSERPRFLNESESFQPGQRKSVNQKALTKKR